MLTLTNAFLAEDSVTQPAAPATLPPAMSSSETEDGLIAVQKLFAKAAFADDFVILVSEDPKYAYSLDKKYVIISEQTVRFLREVFEEADKSNLFGVYVIRDRSVYETPVLTQDVYGMLRLNVGEMRVLLQNEITRRREEPLALERAVRQLAAKEKFAFNVGIAAIIGLGVAGLVMLRRP